MRLSICIVLNIVTNIYGVINMSPLHMMNAITLNPLGGWTREVVEWYWQGVRVQDTRRDNLNLAMYN